MNRPADRAIVIGLDGASMELVRNMAKWGHVPHLAHVLERGASRGMIGTFPTLTAPGWTTVSTAAWPGTHRITDFNMRALGKPLTSTVWGVNTALSESEYFWNTVERAGRTPILVKWEMSWPPTVTTGIQVEGTGPGVVNHHQIAGYHLFTAGRWAPRPIGGDRDPETLDPSALQETEEYDVVKIRPAGEWQGAPHSQRPLLEVELTVKPLGRSRPNMKRGETGTPKTYLGLIYATTDAGYDRLLVTADRNAAAPLADLGAGEWSAVCVDTFTIDDQPVEGAFRLKLITLGTDADEFELFVSQIWPPGGDFAVPAGTAEELYERFGGPFLQNPGRDALGLFDDETYFEHLDRHHAQLGDYATHLTSTREWDVLFVETHASDYANHFFLAQADPISGASDAAVERSRKGLIRTYQSIDIMIGKLLELADERTVIAVVSDHGGTPNRNRPVDINRVLEEAGLAAFDDSTNSKKRRVDLSKTQAYGLGLAYIFLNVEGREEGGIVPPEDYESARAKVIEALHAYTDPSTGEHPFVLAITREDAEMLNLSGDLVGDVVYALKPGYDGAHGKQLPSATFGIGGQHSTFILSGAGVREGVELARQVRSVDVMPTLAYLLGLPMPRDVEGGVVYEALEDPNWQLTELERLDG